MHFGISEGKGGVKIWKPSVVGYGYFLELPISLFSGEISVSVMLRVFLASEIGQQLVRLSDK